MCIRDRVKYDKWKGRTKGSKPGQVDFYRSTELGPLAGSTAGNQKIRRVKDIKNAIPLAKFKSKLSILKSPHD